MKYLSRASPVHIQDKLGALRQTGPQDLVFRVRPSFFPR